VKFGEQTMSETLFAGIETGTLEDFGETLME
jgi:hypothetical protein